jgi:hypothetical protein
MTRDEIDIWFDISGALFRDLMPRNLVEHALGGGMTRFEHAFLAHREECRVDEALITLAMAADERCVKAVFSRLTEDTIIALASRWLHYTRTWKDKERTGDLSQYLIPGHWDDWRAVFLSMIQDKAAATSACRFLWPEEFPAQT